MQWISVVVLSLGWAACSDNPAVPSDAGFASDACVGEVLDVGEPQVFSLGITSLLGTTVAASDSVLVIQNDGVSGLLSIVFARSSEGTFTRLNDIPDNPGPIVVGDYVIGRGDREVHRIQGNGWSTVQTLPSGSVVASSDALAVVDGDDTSATLFHPSDTIFALQETLNYGASAPLWRPTLGDGVLFFQEVSSPSNIRMFRWNTAGSIEGAAPHDFDRLAASSTHLFGWRDGSGIVSAAYSSGAIDSFVAIAQSGQARIAPTVGPRGTIARTEFTSGQPDTNRVVIRTPSNERLMLSRPGGYSNQLFGESVAIATSYIAVSGRSATGVGQDVVFIYDVTRNCL